MEDFVPREWMLIGPDIVECSRCGTVAFASLGQARAAASSDLLAVGQDVPADCGRLVLKAVREL